MLRMLHMLRELRMLRGHGEYRTPWARSINELICKQETNLIFDMIKINSKI